jgi:putative redox protein
LIHINKSCYDNISNNKRNQLKKWSPYIEKIISTRGSKMKAQLKWTEGMKLEATSDGNSVPMDAKPPIGKNSAMTPKELVAVGLGGCTAMDVLALLKKHKQAFTSFDVDVDITTSTSGHPIVFASATITFSATGEIDRDILLESVRLSQTKFCGVSAMLSKALPINYIVKLNGEQIGDGQANFGAANG